MARKRESSKPEEGGANWMDTYGDMVTLLLTFFVLLFAFSTINAEKWQALVGAMTGTRTVVIEPLSPSVVAERPVNIPNLMLPQTDLENNTETTDQPQEWPIIPPVINPDYPTESEWELMLNQYNREYEAFLKLIGNLQSHIETNQVPAELDIDFDLYTVTIRFNEQMFFDTGSAVIKSESYPVIDRMTEFFAENQQAISECTVEGHTDNVPISTDRYPSNWELSSARASSVIRYIESIGAIDSIKMSSGGYGETRPIESNDTSEGRAMNRRVDFVLQAYYTRNFAIVRN